MILPLSSGVKKLKENYVLNACRVLLTRARQGMVIGVPEGEGWR
jgi:hypothetical protein